MSSSSKASSHPNLIPVKQSNRRNVATAPELGRPVKGRAAGDGQLEDEDRAYAINSLAICDNSLPSSYVLCSRLDHLFEPGASYRDHLCVAHDTEVSSEMCDDCVLERAATEEQDLRCSCCGVEIENVLHSSYLLMKPPWEITQNGNLEQEREYGGCRGRHHSLLHRPHNPLVCYLCQQPYIR